MAFCWSTLKVKNMEESLKFYEEIVGLTINRRFWTDSNTEIVFLGDGETKVELICEKEKEGIFIGNDISLGFSVTSLEKMMERIKDQKLNIEGGPFQPNPQIKFIFVRDPNGLRIQLIENL